MQPMQSLLIGSGCRAVVAMMFMPVLVVKTRIESGRFGTTYNPTNLFKSLTQIAQYEGVRALWKGSLATILRDAPFSGLYYVFYQQTKGILETKQLDFDGVNETGRQMNSNGCKLADTRRAQGGDVYSEAPVPCRIDDAVCAAEGVGRNITDKLQAGYCGQQDNQTQTKVQTQTQTKVQTQTQTQTQTKTQNQTQTDTPTQTPEPIQSRMPPTVLTSETAGSVPKHAYLQSDFLIRLLSGFIAGICATVVSHPPDIIRARLQASDKPHITTYSVVTQLLKEEGARGLLIGVWPRMIRRSLTAALSWTLFEQLVDLWEAQLSNKQSAQY
ncbi:hypothetical protein SARC_06516 [Sphaeroforma arctica JP610]|uniref:Solute carrier family 25 member 38 homolog n=1 Tax=Sphaeroforma arctica JP610 TaxID=667725 RepID=A0A0L0FWZ1_9EUKA|nr:hypothetical protein SARC_06516 [Sphaeroforma arctica JP610]KNC81149.1 hypothetical protein SARC_06516 [Sphaeroforma arctica JP610]|eukprot:XP_014155051.1 hypothetical protein SARC_06516 [Sphaeroforma arctica JP610]